MRKVSSHFLKVYLQIDRQTIEEAIVLESKVLEYDRYVLQVTSEGNQ